MRVTNLCPPEIDKKEATIRLPVRRPGRIAAQLRPRPLVVSRMPSWLGQPLRSNRWPPSGTRRPAPAIQPSPPRSSPPMSSRLPHLPKGVDNAIEVVSNPAFRHTVGRCFGRVRTRHEADHQRDVRSRPTTDSSPQPPVPPPGACRPNPMAPSRPSAHRRSRCARRASARWRSRSRWRGRGIRSGRRWCRAMTPPAVAGCSASCAAIAASSAPRMRAPISGGNRPCSTTVSSSSCQNVKPRFSSCASARSVSSARLARRYRRTNFSTCCAVPCSPMLRRSASFSEVAMRARARALEYPSSPLASDSDRSGNPVSARATRTFSRPAEPQAAGMDPCCGTAGGRCGGSPLVGGCARKA